MKLNKFIALAAFIAVVFTSCKNDLNIQAPYKDITIVYGLMDQNDGTHYIRINKAFEGNANAYTMAKQYDSIYYPVNEINAVLEDSNPINQAITKIQLDTTATVPLSPGIFSYPKQLLYYTNAVLNPNDYYNLVITNTITGKVIRGSTALLEDIAITGIPPKRNNPFSLPSSPLFSQLLWSSSPGGRIYQLTIEFYYDNQFGSGPRVLQTPLQLVFPQETANTNLGGDGLNYDVDEQQLFSLILSEVQPITGVTRYVDSLGIVFTSGTDDLNTYIQLSQPPLGINQDVPSFTDVKNGIGLYTARHVQTYYRNVDMPTLDSLTQEARFKNLGFIP